MTPFMALLARDVKLARASGGALGTALGFYLIVVTLVPLGLGPDLALLARIAPGILWIGVLLSALLSLPRMFEADHEDGALEALALGPLPLEAVAGAKMLAHWLTITLPLVLATPVIGLLLNLELASLPALLASMLAGTPAVSAIGGLGAALALSSRKSGLLLALIVLPLYVPTLILGVLAASATANGDTSAAFALAAAYSLLTIVIGPIATAFALRLNLR